MSTQDDVAPDGLPILDPTYSGPVLYDTKDAVAKYAPIQSLQPPEAGSHVLVALIEVGCGASSAFGRPGRAQTAERLAAGDRSGAPICSDLRAWSNRFSGRVDWGQIDLGLDDHDHLISPEERLRTAMERH